MVILRREGSPGGAQYWLNQTNHESGKIASRAGAYDNKQYFSPVGASSAGESAAG
jgi:hypothetical protein